ncbi:MAG: hypothetical protein AB7G15_10240 [Alphaproteobacteria bacterium]
MNQAQTLAKLPRDDLEALAEAGEEAANCIRVLSKSGDNLVGELLREQGKFYEWEHFPKGDVYDSETHAQYYYHAHAAGDRPNEHGHFHTFLRPKGMPKGVVPASVPDYAPPKDLNDALSHIVGISMDKFGMPLGLFTTNRWVTGEVWYAAPDVIKMLDFFEIDLARPSWPVNRWIGAMLRLFRPQIVELLRARDATIAEWSRRYPAVDVFEDRRLEVTSEIEISIDDQIARIKTLLDRARGAPVRVRKPGR